MHSYTYVGSYGIHTTIGVLLCHYDPINHQQLTTNEQQSCNDNHPLLINSQSERFEASTNVDVLSVSEQWSIRALESRHMGNVSPLAQQLSTTALEGRHAGRPATESLAVVD